jgi:hypothetical protein
MIGAMRPCAIHYLKIVLLGFKVLKILKIL